MDLQKKKNCLRFILKEEVVGESLDRFVLKILEDSLGIRKEEILCMQENRLRKYLDVTLKTEKVCRYGFVRWLEMEDKLKKYFVLQSSMVGKRRSLIIAMDDPFVQTEVILNYLKRHFEFVKLQKILLNSIGIWNGKRKFVVWGKGEEDFSSGRIIVDGKDGFSFWESESGGNAVSKETLMKGRLMETQREEEKLEKVFVKNQQRYPVEELVDVPVPSGFFLSCAVRNMIEDKECLETEEKEECVVGPIKIKEEKENFKKRSFSKVRPGNIEELCQFYGIGKMSDVEEQLVERKEEEKKYMYSPVNLEDAKKGKVKMKVQVGPMFLN